MIEPKKILVTGCMGYIGREIAELAQSLGHDVYGIDILSIDRETSLTFEYSQIDIANYDQIKELFVIHDFDIIYHLAAIAGIADSQNKPLDTVKVNVLGTANILECVRNFRTNCQLIYASTVYVHSQYGSIYAATKKCSELLIEKYAQDFSLKYTFLRFGSVYGPRANHFNFISNTLKKALSGQKLDYEGTGEESREYIHVHDAAQLSLRVMNQEYYNQAFMITGSQKISIRELFELISEILNSKNDFAFNNVSNQDHYKRTPYSYMPKSSKRLIPEMEIDLAGGIVETLKHLDNENTFSQD